MYSINNTSYFEMLNKINDMNYINNYKSLIQEAEDVSSEATDIQDGSQQPQQQSSNQPNLSEEQAMQIAQGLQSGEVKEEELQQAYEKGQLNDADIQLIQVAMEQGADPDNLPPEEKEKLFAQEIDQMTENFTRLGLYDKINDTVDKIDVFTKLYNNPDDGLIKQLKYIKNYFNILSALIYNLDINLIYQMYVSLEIKMINIIREYLGKGEDPEALQFLENIKNDIKKNELKLQYPPEAIAEFVLQKGVDDEEFQNIIKELIELGVYTEDEIKTIIEDPEAILQKISEEQQDESSNSDNSGEPSISEEQAIQIAQKLQSGEIKEEELQQALEQGEMNDADIQMIQAAMEQSQQSSDNNNNDTQDQSDDENNEILDIAKSVLSGEISSDEIIKKFMDNEIDKETFEKIIQAIEELKDSDGDSSQENDNESQKKEKTKKNTEVNSETPE